MNMMDIVFIYVIPSMLTAVLVVLLIGVSVLKSLPTAWLLFMKKCGLAKGGKGYCMPAYDDRLLTTKQMNVYPESAMELEKKRGGGLLFYLAKPQDETANFEANLLNEERDRYMLPPYMLDGVLPVYMGHVSKAIATNPKILAALRVANQMEHYGKKSKFATNVHLGKTVQYLDRTPDEVTGEMVDTAVKTSVMPVEVLLPFDPVDIKKNFPNYWQQSNIDASKKRWMQIGMEKAKQGFKDYIWPIVILGAVAIAGMVVVGLATGLIG